MTDEEIKQNAEAYAKKIYPYTVGKAAATRDFIAGAHSRDEEIKELKWKLAEKSGEVANAIADKVLLKQEINQLRNPWISVEERLPVCMNENQYYRYTDNILVCIQTNLDVLYKVAMFKKEKSSGRELFQIERPFDFDERVTHWMPIPEIPLNK